MESWFLDLLRGSRLVRALRGGLGRVAARLRSARAHGVPDPSRRARDGRVARYASLGALLALLLLLALGSVGLARLLGRVDGRVWLGILGSAALTLGRVLLAVVAGTLWTVPAGLAIGLSPRLSRVLQPVVQVVASFPAPMLFPAVVALLASAGIGIGWGSVLLMLLGTQWYVLFNVVAGAMAVPADLREAARVYRLSVGERMRALYLPSIFPYLVTGWVTAAGGAWNASIVSEYVSYGGRELVANGVGARISVAAAAGDMPTLAAAVASMALLVVLFNRLVWRWLHAFAEERFSLVR
jgi:NitT/TauT family transport system permease protein